MLTVYHWLLHQVVHCLQGKGHYQKPWHVVSIAVVFLIQLVQRALGYSCFPFSLLRRWNRGEQYSLFVGAQASWKGRGFLVGLTGMCLSNHWANLGLLTHFLANLSPLSSRVCLRDVSPERDKRDRYECLQPYIAIRACACNLSSCPDWVTINEEL